MKRFLLFLSFAVPFLATAQSNFRKGYILNNSNDTIKGYVNYREHSSNPVSVQFREQPEGKTQVFDVKNCAGYGVDGLEYLERYRVDISNGKVMVGDLSLGPDSTFRTESIFLKVLTEGKNVTLYSYQDQLKTRFYIKEKGSAVPAELIYQIYLDVERTSSMIKEKKYAGQLMDIIKKYQEATPALYKRLRALPYSESDLLSVVNLINDQHQEKSKYQKVRLFGGAGLNVSKVNYSGEKELAGAGARNKVSYSPLVSAGMDIFANPAIGKLIYRLELSAVRSKTDISVDTEVPASAVLGHSFEQYIFSLTPQLIYNLYNTTPLKIFVGAGFGANFSSYSNNVSTRYNSIRQELNVTEDEVSLEGFHMSFPFRAGAVLNKKIEISAVYIPRSSLTNYAFFDIGIQRFTFGINYLFGK